MTSVASWSSWSAAVRPEIINGSPGSGKTTALLNIVEEELGRGVEPERIGFVSFTRKAADEAATRAAARFGYPRSRMPWMRTLHSLCFRRLGLRRDDVLEGRRMQEFAAHAGVKVTGRWSEDGTLTGFEPGDRILHTDNLSRVRCVPLRQQYDREDDNLPWREVERVVGALAAFKRQRGLMDYTDMLSEFIAHGVPPSLDILIGDEVQDMSTLQWRVFDKLATNCKRVVVGGDDSQAIFLWGGANVDHFVDLAGEVNTLTQSYRVPARVQELAMKVIRPVRHRRQNEWKPRQEQGRVERAREFADLDLDDRDHDGPDPPILVLARNSYLLREQVEPELRRRGVYYERGGRPSVDAGTLSAITAWERLRQGGTATGGECREIYRQMSSGRGVERGHKELGALGEQVQVTIADLKARGGLLVDGIWHEAMDRLPRDDVGYIVKMRQRGERLKSRPRVRLSTIHAAKGGEADHVVLLREMARRTYREMERDQDPERRVFYVACTRARTRLTLVDSQSAQECPWL